MVIPIHIEPFLSPFISHHKEIEQWATPAGLDL
jgi:hypothetical protein